MQDKAHPWKNVSKALLHSLVREVLSRCNNHWDFCFYERERENHFIRRKGERRETASNVCDKLIALQFRFDVCTGFSQYKVSREGFLVVCIGQMHSFSLITHYTTIMICIRCGMEFLSFIVQLG
mmetsp:Transcript_30391/g.47613  ORF Transcript_30391/g.47613 Transcript_30391/m.47613 type:complete len:124 (+) Transcript_30391:5-376(+)